MGIGKICGKEEALYEKIKETEAVLKKNHGEVEENVLD